jgi:hypothetical protein
VPTETIRREKSEGAIEKKAIVGIDGIARFQFGISKDEK